MRSSLVLVFVLLAGPLHAQDALGREPFRPQFHFTPIRNWTNDPNGMVWYKGEWHLFYQHNPEGNTWGHMSWGHAVSRDLIHWEHLPVALAEEGGVMIFSGSAVVDRDNTSGLCQSTEPRDRSCLVALYTGHTDTNQSQHLAYSNDRGRTWTKFPGNPVLNVGMKDFRDPKVFWHASSKQWVMVVALPTQQRVRFYGSPNLTQWTPLGEFGPAGATNGLWECPDLFELPVEGRPGRSRWVLVVNFNPGAPAGGSGAQYFVGQFDGHSFTSDDAVSRTRFVDYGKDFYAGVTWSDVPRADGRRVWLGWMTNWEYANDEPTTPFRGAMTVPRELVLRRAGSDVVLAQRPVAELRTLRGTPQRFGPRAFGAGQDPLAGSGLRGRAMELLLDLSPGTAREVTLNIRSGPGEDTRIGYDAAKGELFVDRTRSGQVGFSPHFAGRHSAPVQLERGRLRLHLFIDWSSVEVFVNGGTTVFTERIFPSPTSQGVSLSAVGGTARLNALEAWPLRSAFRAP